MATLQELEQALVNADKAGDSDAARRLAVAVVEARKSQSASQYIPGALPRDVTAVTPSPTVVDRIKGIGEAALTTGTAALATPLAALAGINEFGGKVANALAGNQDVVDRPSTAFSDVMQAATYQPRTEAGQEAVRGVASVAEALTPLTGLGAEVGAIGRAAGQGARATVPVAAATAQRAVAEVPDAVKASYQAARGRINQAFGLTDDFARADGGAVGAAGVERARRLTETSQQLPVPVNLTKGELTGDLAQIRFEQEQAKGALGAPIRERSAATNRVLGQNIEALIDRTGAETASNIEAGRVVTGELSRAAAAEKARYRSLYQQADRAGQLSDPVDLQGVADYLNENRAGRSSAPIMNVIADQLKVQGVGGGNIADGSLNIASMTIKQAEQLRKAVNRFVKDSDPNDVRVASDLRRLIDDSTEGAGGQSYVEARKARQRYAQLFENNAIVSDLIKNRRGTTDRQVALEDVFRRTILNGSRDDLGMLRRTLDIADQRQGIAPGTTGGGAQAWKELQGSTLRHLLDEAQKGFAVDAAGAQRFSGAQLNVALRNLERGGKLEFVLGKRTAQTLRDLNEIARAVQSYPPGAVNTSNTASVILAALAEAGATGAVTGLPLPAVSALRAASQAIKDKKTRARIQASLNYRPGPQQ